MTFFGPDIPRSASRRRIGFTIEPQEGVEGVIAICDVCVDLRTPCCAHER